LALTVEEFWRRSGTSLDGRSDQPPLLQQTAQAQRGLLDRVPGESSKERDQWQADRKIQVPVVESWVRHERLLNDKSIKKDAVGIIGAPDQRDAMRIAQTQVDRRISDRKSSNAGNPPRGMQTAQ
jgi:hypothetical protein